MHSLSPLRESHSVGHRISSALFIPALIASDPTPSFLPPGWTWFSGTARSLSYRAGTAPTMPCALNSGHRGDNHRGEITHAFFLAAPRRVPRRVVGVRIPQPDKSVGNVSNAKRPTRGPRRRSAVTLLSRVSANGREAV